MTNHANLGCMPACRLTIENERDYEKQDDSGLDSPSHSPVSYTHLLASEGGRVRSR